MSMWFLLLEDSSFDLVLSGFFAMAPKSGTKILKHHLSHKCFATVPLLIEQLLAALQALASLSMSIAPIPRSAVGAVPDSTFAIGQETVNSKSGKLAAQASS